jgi:excisionase family DNA binding protein
MRFDPLVEPPHLLDVAQVAHHLRASADKVRGLIASGQLPALRLGRSYRIREQDLKTFITAEATKLAKELNS